MQDPFDASTIIFALLAIFVLWKLRSVLGTRGGPEKPQEKPLAPQNSFFKTSGATNDNKVVPLPGAAPRPAPAAPPPPPVNPARWGSYAEPGSRVANGLDAIAAADPGFDLDQFIAGAKSAYEMIVAAFATSDRELLARLLDKDVYESFAAAIEARASRGESLMTKVVSIDKTGVFDAAARDATLQITLRFMTTLISATHDKDGKLIDGDPEKTVNMVDLWTFARPAGSRDPNWKLIATQTGH
jgi:predicted lipid-binding transport protein (Tim44 family)